MRSFLSFLFLLLFLFPVVEKEMHAWEHEGESHCAEHELTHLHEKQHDCSICDFTFEKADDFQFQPPLAYFFIEFPKFLNYTSQYTEKEFYFFSLRAPPALV